MSAAPIQRPDAPLFNGAEWDFALLKRVYGAIEDIALKDLKLDVYPNQIEIISSEQMLDAYSALESEAAVKVRIRDEEGDEHYTALFRELLTYMMEDPRTISACAHLLFVAKNLERVGDHCTNIAEEIHFLVTGETLVNERPKVDALNSK